MSDDNPKVQLTSKWRKEHFESLEALRNHLAESRLLGRRLLDSLPEPDRQYLLTQIAAAIGISLKPTGDLNVNIDVLHSSPETDFPVEKDENSDSRLKQLEMQLESCLESLTRTEEKLMEAEIRAEKLSEELAGIVFSRAWKFTSKICDLRVRLVPRGSWREQTAKKILRRLRDCYRVVRHPPIDQLPARTLGLAKAYTPSAIRSFVYRHRHLAAKFVPERVREYLRITMDRAVNLRSPLQERLDEFLMNETGVAFRSAKECEKSVAFQSDEECNFRGVKGNYQSRVFVIFSGTTFCESEGQRPTRLARELARRGVPVLFCYWRWRATELPQVAKFPHVFCLPIDVFLKMYDSLFADPRLADMQRTLLMEFPHPALLEVVNYANAFGWKTVYDAIDDWEEFHRCGQAFWYDRDFESYLMSNADFCTITCPKLLEILSPQDPARCHLLPNAYEDWEGEGIVGQVNTAKLSKDKEKITIGYFGHLTSSWFDWTLVMETAKRHPEWKFEIIGYGMDAKLESLPNVVHLGKVEHSRLPTYAKSWDVAMIPFKLSRLSEAVDPIKIYEYIALNLSTVVTGMPHLASYPGVFTAENISQFEEAVEAASQHPLNDAEVKEFLGRNRWANRVDQLFNLLDQKENQSPVSLALSQ